MKKTRRLSVLIIVIATTTLAFSPAWAQGTLEDFARANQFLPWNARKLVLDSDVSPDGRWIAFVRDHNLFVSSTETGQEIQLTRDGERDYDYATPLPMAGALINQDENNDRRPRPVGVTWSPDSRRLITYRIDSRY